MKRILITAPVRQDADIFREYLKSLGRLELPEGYETETYFVVNNCPEAIREMRECDKWIVKDTETYYQKTDNDHIWTRDNMDSMMRLRNETICYALANGFDYWFSVDSDLILQPETL